MITILGIEALRWTSTIVSICVKFILALYFSILYLQKGRRTHFVLTAGFFFLGFSQLPILALRYFRDPALSVPFAMLGAFLAAVALTLLYYGVSLLFFKEKSFMREKFSLILLVIMLAAVTALPFMVPAERILTSVFLMVATGFIFPVLLFVAAVFFVIWHDLERSDTRKINTFVVGLAWLIYSLTNGVGSLFYNGPLEWIFSVLAILATLLLLYGMTLGRATEH